MSVTRGRQAAEDVKAKNYCYTLSGCVAASTVTVVADDIPHSKRALCHFINHACKKSANCEILWVCDEKEVHRPFCKSGPLNPCIPISCNLSENKLAQIVSIDRWFLEHS